jgi:hypothetical protein
MMQPKAVEPACIFFALKNAKNKASAFVDAHKPPLYPAYRFWLYAAYKL